MYINMNTLSLSGSPEDVLWRSLLLQQAARHRAVLVATGQPWRDWCHGTDPKKAPQILQIPMSLFVAKYVCQPTALREVRFWTYLVPFSPTINTCSTSAKTKLLCWTNKRNCTQSVAKLDVPVVPLITACPKREFLPLFE